MIGRERPGQQSEVAQLISQTLEQERRQREMMEQQYAQYDADDDEVSTEQVSRHSLSEHVSDCLNMLINHPEPVGAGSNLLSMIRPCYKPQPVTICHIKVQQDEAVLLVNIYRKSSYNLFGHIKNNGNTLV